MKFWVTLIVSIILISAVITWMGQKGGQSYGSSYTGPKAAPRDPNAAPPPRMALPAKIVFNHQGQSDQDADVITFKGPDSVVGEPSSIMLGFQNVGDGPLEITLEAVGCGCVHDVSLGKLTGKPAKPEWKALKVKEGPVMFFQPKEPGMIQVSWTPEEKQLKAGMLAQDANLQFTFGTNDSLYPMIRLELHTRISLPKEAKPKP